MNTTHGVKMSPAMANLWRFIQEQGINLCDFSTDECVEREQEKLKAGEEVLLRRIAATAPPSRELEHLLADYRAIMNRRPHERTDRAMQASEAAALRARGMAEDEIAKQIEEKAR